MFRGRSSGATNTRHSCPAEPLIVIRSGCYTTAMKRSEPSVPVAHDLSASPPKVKRHGDTLALEVSPEQGQRIAGTTDPDFLETLTNGVAAATRGQGSDVRAVNASLAALAGIQPRDELEAMLAAQMTAVHSMAMEMSKRALLSKQTVEGVSANVSRASRLMRTFCAQVEALQRYRNAGQSTVTVQHVTVGEGGQAIIGNVEKGGGGSG